MKNTGDTVLMKHTVSLKPALLTLLVLTVLIPTFTLLSAETEPDWASEEFVGSEAEVEALIEHYRTIELTPEQEAIRVAALQDMPAPCCSEFSAATCCCECNLSRSLWGLSKVLIVEHQASAEQVRKAVEAWVAALNPEGYEGKTCSTGSCNRPFKHDGCGGMSDSHVVFESAAHHSGH